MNAEKERQLAERVKSFRYYKSMPREKSHLDIRKRDLLKNFDTINQIGVAKADYVCEHWKDFGFSEQGKCQLYFDFIVQFESLRNDMKEFRWSKEYLKQNGIDFIALKKLYYSVV